MKRRTAMVSVVGVASLLVLVGGCASSRSEELLGEARFSPAPGMANLQQTEDQAENAAFITFDHNWRAARSDLGRFLLVDKPSRLGPEPIR